MTDITSIYIKPDKETKIEEIEAFISILREKGLPPECIMSYKPGHYTIFLQGTVLKGDKSRSSDNVYIEIRYQKKRVIYIGEKYTLWDQWYALDLCPQNLPKKSVYKLSHQHNALVDRVIFDFLENNQYSKLSYFASSSIRLCFDSKQKITPEYIQNQYGVNNLPQAQAIASQAQGRLDGLGEHISSAMRQCTSAHFDELDLKIPALNEKYLSSAKSLLQQKKKETCLNLCQAINSIVIGVNKRSRVKFDLLKENTHQFNAFITSMSNEEIRKNLAEIFNIILKLTDGKTRINKLGDQLRLAEFKELRSILGVSAGDFYSNIGILHDLERFVEGNLNKSENRIETELGRVGQISSNNAEKMPHQIRQDVLLNAKILYAMDQSITALSKRKMSHKENQMNKARNNFVLSDDNQSKQEAMVEFMNAVVIYQGSGLLGFHFFKRPNSEVIFYNELPQDALARDNSLSHP